MSLSIRLQNLLVYLYFVGQWLAKPGRTLISGNGRSVHAVADTHDDSADEQLSKRIGSSLAGNLNNDTESHNEGAHHDVLASTQQIAGPEDEHGTNQASNFVDGSD